MKVAIFIHRKILVLTREEEDVCVCMYLATIVVCPEPWESHDWGACSPFVSIGWAKSLVLTNGQTQIRMCCPHLDVRGCALSCYQFLLLQWSYMFYIEEISHIIELYTSICEADY